MSTYGWTRSSRCAAGDCVEVVWDAGEVLVRDSKLGEQSAFQVWTVEEWQELLRAIRVAEHPLAVQHPGVGRATLGDSGVVLGLDWHVWLSLSFAEWDAFCRDVDNGEFTPEALAAASEDQPAAQPAEATDTAVSVAAGAVNANTAPAPNSPAGVVWAVVFGNNEPAEVDDLFATKALAEDHAEKLGAEWQVERWRIRDDSSRSALDGSAKPTAADQNYDCSGIAAAAADAWAKGRAADTCPCAPAGFSPGTYEGPVRECPLHGDGASIEDGAQR